MNSAKIKEPIAQRRLTAGVKTITVTIEKPFPSEDDYSCSYLIDYGNRAKYGYAIGVDSVQAIQLAMKKIGIELSAASKELGEEVYWLEAASADTGFPS